jgi:uncharacterized FAD-dependent dehydrogenase
MKNNYDVIIVGAGPAGLATAFELTSITDLSILIVDKGKSIAGRTCSSLEKLCIDHPICNVTHGSGGAGLYSDGKLCLDPTVGGDISRFYGYQDTAEFMQRVMQMLALDNQAIQTNPSQSNAEDCRELFKGHNLGFKYYDVVRVGLKDRIRKVRTLEDYLRNKGVEFKFNTEMHSISLNGQCSIATSKENFHSKYLVVASGKIGANWFYEQCQKLGVESENNPLYLGVRLEMPRQVTSQLAQVTDNPKISMNFPNGDYVKTHCFSDKGKVVIADYNGLKLVEGNYLETAESENASFNIIIRLNLPKSVIPYEFSRRFIEQVNSFGNGRPVVQTVRDLSDFRETDPRALRDLAISPTLNDCKCGDLSHLYSVRFADRLSKFIQQVDEVLPGFAQGENIVYAPFVEWWVRKVDVNRFFETNRPNLYAVGDGAGMSQGIIAAGMQGIACARGIYEKER